jgi:hypothetical protein
VELKILVTEIENVVIVTLRPTLEEPSHAEG